MAFFDWKGFISGILSSTFADPAGDLVGILGATPGWTFTQGITSITGSISAANGTPVTIAHLPGGTGWSVYLASVTINNVDDAANYNATALVSTNGTATRLTNLQTGGLMTVSLSGFNLQATQGSGGTQTLTYSILKITP